MDQRLPQLYKDYGNYSNWRSMPLDLDGLKPVERRVLLSAYKIARQKFVKSRQVDAYTIGHYHPHGECYGSIVQLVRQGFLTGQGNFGTNVGVEPVGPAAPRYTECKINQLILDLAFKYIDHVPFVDTELGDTEPLFLPAMFPICLMGTEYTQGIGFGYKTFIPCYNIKDLYQRLLWLLGIRKRKPIIAPITDCEILSPQPILDGLLTTGSAKIEVKGVIDINIRNNTVTLKSWPPGKRFESMLNKFAAELDSGMVGFTDLSASETKIVFEILRERNRDKIFTDFIEKINEAITGTISFETTVVDINQKVLVKSIDAMLLDTFKMFTEVNKQTLQDEIDKATAKIEEYILLQKIRPSLIDCIQKSLTTEDTLKSINKITGIEESIISELINKYKISKLVTLNTDTSILTQKRKESTDNLNNLSTYVLQQYSGF
jgi:DNA gyrase/topoisomerase IV subunit A